MNFSSPGNCCSFLQHFFAARSQIPYMNDAELVQQVLSGNNNAFRFLVLKHQRLVAHVVSRIIQRHSDVARLPFFPFIVGRRDKCFGDIYPFCRPRFTALFSFRIVGWEKSRLLNLIPELDNLSGNGLFIPFDTVPSQQWLQF
jgi:hypothetical protein